MGIYDNPSSLGQAALAALRDVTKTDFVNKLENVWKGHFGGSWQAHQLRISGYAENESASRGAAMTVSTW